MTDLTPTPTSAYAIFAAGCFWCVESEFQAIDGVLEVTSGYAGGTFKNPTYELVCSKKTDHLEAVLVRYNPTIISYEKLLDAFWLIHDPTQANGQGPDIGAQYRSAILPLNDVQRDAAEKAKAQADASGSFGKPIMTEIIPVTEFHEAEDYHQDYYQKKGIDYQSVFELGGESTTMAKRKRWSLFG